MKMSKHIYSHFSGAAANMVDSLRIWLAHTPIGALYQSPLRARFASGVLWSLIGAVVSQGLSLVTSVITARLLGQVRFGELGMINSTIALFGTLAGLGLGLTATKHIAELRSKEPARVGRIIGLLSNVAFATGGLVSLVAFLFAPVFATQILNAPHLINELRLSCGLLFLNALNGVQIGALSGLEAFRTIAWVSSVGGLFSLLSIALGAQIFGLSGAVGGYVVSAAVSCLINHAVLRCECHRAHISIAYRGTWVERSILWTFALPALIVSLTTQPCTWLTRVFLANQPNGYAELGIFSAAFTWSNVLLFLPQQISRPSMPILADLYGQGHTKTRGRVVRVNLTLTVGLAGLTAVPLMLLAPHIMHAYGESFTSGWRVLVVILLAYVIGAGTLVFRDVIASSGQMWWQVLHSIVWGIVLIVATIFLIEHGALGLAFAYLIAYVIFFAIQLALLFSRRIFAVQPSATGWEG